MARDEVNILSQSIEDEKTKIAVRQLERIAASALVRIDELEVDASSGGGGVTLPISISDVTGLSAALASKALLTHTHDESDIAGLTADLAAKVPTSRTISISPGTGGGDLSANRTLLVADNAVGQKGVVAAATGNATDYWAGDSTWHALPGTSTGSLSISSSIPPAAPAINVSSVGTVDWFVLNSASRPSVIVPGSLHAKITGDLLLANGFTWITNGASVTSFGAQTPTASTTLSDSVASAALTGNGTFGFVAGTTLGMGFRFHIPVDTTGRTLRLLVGQFSCGYSIIAELSDGSASSVSSSATVANGVNQRVLWDVAYAAAGSAYLNVTVQMTVNSGGTPNLGMFWAAIF